jgi:hypothetical protein
LEIVGVWKDGPWIDIWSIFAVVLVRGNSGW